jgi:FkbM family methyltransferase
LRFSTRQKVFIAAQISRCLLTVRRAIGKGPEVQVVRRSVKWQLDLREGIDLAIYLGVYENETADAIAREIREDWVALDIGANIGAHTLPIADRIGPGGRVVAFEPTGYAFAKLRRNIALNPGLAGRIDCHQTVLVDKPPTAPLPPIYSSWPLVDASDVHPVLRGRLMSTEGAAAATLDHFIQVARLGRLDFIKMDVDGNEPAVLEGARETLARHRPAIIMEFCPHLYSRHGADSFPALLALLHDLDYRAETKIAARPVSLTSESVKALCPDGGSVDLILRPN